MLSQKDKVKIGAFALLTLVLLAFSSVTLLGLKFNEKYDTYTIQFKQSVAGLSVGSQVQVRGVRVGSVARIRIDPKNVEIVEVKVELQVGTPVMSNTRAMLASQGITGLQFINLEGGTRDAKRLDVGSFIKPGEGLFQKLTNRADEISARTDEIIIGLEEMTRPANRKRFDRILGQTEVLVKESTVLVTEMTATLKTTRGILEKNETSVGQIIRGVGRASGELNGVLKEARLTLAEGRQVIKDSDVPGLVKGLAQTNETVRQGVAKLDMTSVSGMLATLQTLLAQISRSLGQNQEQFRAIMFNLRQTSDHLKEMSRSISDKPSKLIFDDKPAPRKLP